MPSVSVHNFAARFANVLIASVDAFMMSLAADVAVLLALRRFMDLALQPEVLLRLCCLARCSRVFLFGVRSL